MREQAGAEIGLPRHQDEHPYSGLQLVAERKGSAFVIHKAACERAGAWAEWQWDCSTSLTVSFFICKLEHRFHKFLYSMRYF